MKINWGKVFATVGFIIISLIFCFAALMIVGGIRENHCHEQAKKIVGDQGSILVNITKEEQNKYVTGNKISWSLQEQLKCESEFGGGAILGWLIILSPVVVGAYLLLREKRWITK